MSALLTLDLDDQQREFAAFCKSYRISKGLQKTLAKMLSDRWSFQEALLLLNPQRIDSLTKQFIWLVNAHLNEFSFAPDLATGGISKKALVNSAAELRTIAGQLRAELLTFLELAGPAAEFHKQNEERRLLVSHVENLRTSIDSVDDLTASLSALTSVFGVTSKGRKLPTIGTTAQLRDRFFAKLWVESGQKITTTKTGKFAKFLEHTYCACGRNLQSLSDNLQVAKAEQQTQQTSLEGGRNIGVELARAEILQRQQAFDKYYRGRSRGLAHGSSRSRKSQKNNMIGKNRY